jgi:hypothetical protein
MCLLVVTDNAKCPTEDCRIEDRIAKKLVSALNAVLLMDGLNLGADVAKLHSSFRPFMVRTWLTTRDRELKVCILVEFFQFFEMIVELLVTILKVGFYRLMSSLAADPPIFERKLVMYFTGHCESTNPGIKYKQKNTHHKRVADMT